MKKILLLILIAPLLFAVPAAYAAPSDVSGSFTGSTPVVTSTRTVGGVTIVKQDIRVTLSGTFSGQCVGSETDMINEKGTFLVQGTCTFDGVIGIRSGTTVFVVRGVGTRNGFHGHFVTMGSSGGLEGLHSWGTFQATGPGTGTYLGHYFFTD